MASNDDVDLDDIPASTSVKNQFNEPVDFPDVSHCATTYSDCHRLLFQYILKKRGCITVGRLTYIIIHMKLYFSSFVLGRIPNLEFHQ